VQRGKKIWGIGKLNCDRKGIKDRSGRAEVTHFVDQILQKPVVKKKKMSVRNGMGMRVYRGDGMNQKSLVNVSARSAEWGRGGKRSWTL